MANPVLELDSAYMAMFDAVQNFFRFHKSHDMEEQEFDDAYYERVAVVLKKRIDHELKYLHSPILT